jgi:V/A-type H+/Na+-transporting ATPase subunit C
VSGGVSSYASLSAKIRIMYSHLLAASDWAAAMDATDVPSLVDALRNTSYAGALERIAEREPSKDHVSLALKQELAWAYESVIQTAPDQARGVLVQLYRRHELENLKALLRGISIEAGGAADGGSWDRVRRLLFPLGARTTLPVERLTEAGSVAAAVEVLKGGPYHEVLAFALKRYSSEQSLFPLEVALDLYYWRRLWQETVNLQGLDQREAMRITGALVDMNNVMWAIRYRVYHHLSEEELINYTLSAGYRVRDQDIRSVAAGADIAAVVQRLYPAVEDAASLLERPNQGLPQLEIQLKRHVVRQCEAAFLGDPFHVGLALALLVLQDLEVQDMVLLLEAKSSGLAAEEYASFLVREPVAHA